MHKYITMACVMPLMLWNATPVHADNDALRPVLEARYAAMKNAMAEHDSKAVSALLAPGFTTVDTLDHEENANQVLQDIASIPKDPDKTSTTDLSSIKVNGDTAVVEQNYDMHTVKTAPDGNKKNVELKTTSTDTWVNVKGNWLIQKTMTDQIEYFVDGKSVMHKVRNATP